MENWEMSTLYILSLICFTSGIWMLIYEIIAKLTWISAKGKFRGCFNHSRPIKLYNDTRPLVEYQTNKGIVSSDGGPLMTDSWCRYSLNQYLFIYYNPRKVTQFRIKGNKANPFRIVYSTIMIGSGIYLFILASGIIS